MLRERFVLAANRNRGSVPPSEVEAYQLHGNVFAFMEASRTGGRFAAFVDDSLDLCLNQLN